jgi:hypothetical protein
MWRQEGNLPVDSCPFGFETYGWWHLFADSCPFGFET